MDTKLTRRYLLDTKRNLTNVDIYEIQFHFSTIPIHFLFSCSFVFSSFIETRSALFKAHQLNQHSCKVIPLTLRTFPRPLDLGPSRNRTIPRTTRIFFLPFYFHSRNFARSESSFFDTFFISRKRRANAIPRACCYIICNIDTRYLS